MSAYYNEFDATAAHVLRHLIAGNVIAPGDVDTRSIKDVHADDLKGYTQCHFFAGGGLWSVAARLAGWPDDKPLWTGSCPCQPFSQAGQGRGFADERHLWPDFHRLIRAVRPNVVVGEQVAGALGYGWLDGVAADLAAEGYASGAVDIPACAVDAPNIRQRLYWVAMADAGLLDGRAGPVQPSDGQEPANVSGQLVNASRIGWGEGRPEPEFRSGRATAAGADASGVTLGDAIQPGLERQPRHGDGEVGRQEPSRPVAETDGGDGQMGHAAAPGSFSTAHPGIHRGEESPWPRDAQPQRRNGSFWSDHEWIEGHDGKARRTKPRLCDVAYELPGSMDRCFGLGPVTDGEHEILRNVLSHKLLIPSFPGRVAAWKIAGNAINVQLASEVLGALMETMDG
jgi:DNA (cytosine-5)-methyltransferase 1